MKKIVALSIIFAISTIAFAQDITGSWNGTLDVGMAKLRLVVNITQTKEGYASTLDSPDQGAKGILANETTWEGNKLYLQCDAIKMTYNGKLEGDSIRGVFTQMGQSFPLNLARGGVKLNRPQDPTPPFLYHSEDIEFENKEANIKLAATFTYPIMGSNFPVVVLIAGSGGHNRDEEILGHKTFLVLSNYLTNNGIAVLRYDKRGIGQSGGKYDGAVTSADFAADAYSAVEYLKSKKEIDVSKIGLIGHSEGGMIAFMLGNKHADDIAFVVSMAGTGITGKELARMQSKDAYSAERADESKALENQKLAMDMIELIEKHDDAYIQKNVEALVESVLPDGMKGVDNIRKIMGAQLGQTSSPWWRFFLAHDPQEDLLNIVCPVFALNGDLDVQVDAKVNLEAIDKYLVKTRSKKIKTYPMLNHLFQTAQTGAVGEYSTIEETISPEVLKDIRDWIKEIMRTRD